MRQSTRKITDDDVRTLAALNAVLSGCTLGTANAVLRRAVDLGMPKHIIIRAHQRVCTLRAKEERRDLLSEAAHIREVQK